MGESECMRLTEKEKKKIVTGNLWEGEGEGGK